MDSSKGGQVERRRCPTQQRWLWDGSGTRREKGQTKKEEKRKASSKTLVEYRSALKHGGARTTPDRMPKRKSQKDENSKKEVKRRSLSCGNNTRKLKKVLKEI